MNLARYDLSGFPSQLDQTYLHPLEFRTYGFTMNDVLLIAEKGDQTETDSGCWIGISARNLVDDTTISSIGGEQCDIAEEEVASFLKKFNPHQVTESDFHRFPLHSSGDEYSVAIRRSTRDFGYGELPVADIVFVSAKRGEKVIGTVVGDDRTYIETVQTLGYLMAPSKNRVAIIVGYASNGMGDTFPRWIAFRVFGASLSVGFKR